MCSVSLGHHAVERVLTKGMSDTLIENASLLASIPEGGNYQSLA